MRPGLKEALEKAAHFCAYQERTQTEVRKKLYDLGVFGDDAEELIAELVQDGFVNEERFARLFAGGKFRIKKWGRLKIERELKRRDLSTYCINAGLSEISEADYVATLLQLIEKKKDSDKTVDFFVKRKKIANYLIYRGFEPELVWTHVKNLI